jgi:hypothetical protein
LAHGTILPPVRNFVNSKFKLGHSESLEPNVGLAVIWPRQSPPTGVTITTPDGLSTPSLGPFLLRPADQRGKPGAVAIEEAAN